jgi:hypothetical protein
MAVKRAANDFSPVDDLLESGFTAGYAQFCHRVFGNTGLCPVTGDPWQEPAAQQRCFLTINHQL